MSYLRILAALFCLTLSTICLLPAYSAYEDRIPIIGLKNISFDLDSEQEYNISTNATFAMSVQGVTINSTIPDGKNASIMILSMNMVTMDVEGEESQIINQSQFSRSMEDMVLASMRLANGRELEKVVVNNTNGDNITLHRIAMPSSINQPGSEMIFAFWDLDELNHVILSSEIGMNSTRQIVETLKVEP